MKRKKLAVLLMAFMTAVTPAESAFANGNTEAVVTVQTQEVGAKSAVSDFSYTDNENGTVTITGYKGKAKDVVIPEKINGKSVVAIGGFNAFSGKDITSVSMPSVEMVGFCAFQNCKKLTKVSMPKVVNIGLSSFAGTGITSIDLPQAEGISNGAFSECKRLTSVRAPKVKIIGHDAFSDCERLSDITFSEDLGEIGPCAFANTSVKTVRLNGNVTLYPHSLGFDRSSDGTMTKIKGFKLYGKKGSTVEKYAKENKLTFVDINGSTSSRVTRKSIPLQAKKTVSAASILSAKDSNILSLETTDSNIASISNKTFKIAGKASGKATVTAKLKDGSTVKIAVTVKKKVTTTKITGITGKIALKKGQKYTFKPVLNPITSTDKVTYSSSNRKVATVSSNGMVNARKKGTAKITIKAGKQKVVCMVTVK